MVFKINNNWCVDIEEREDNKPSVNDSMLSKAKLIFYHENKPNGVVLNMVIERYGESKQHWRRVKMITDELFNGLSDDERKVFIDKVLNIENNRIKVKPDEDMKPCFTIEELRHMGGIALSPGDKVSVRSSKNTGVYVVTMPKMGNNLYCSCPAWKFQKKPASARTCKHCIAVAKL